MFMWSCLKHTPCWWLREMPPPASKICQRVWVLVCVLQSFLCTAAQIPALRQWVPGYSKRVYTAEEYVYPQWQVPWENTPCCISPESRTQHCHLCLAICTDWEQEDGRQGEKKGGDRKDCSPLDCHPHLSSAWKCSPRPCMLNPDA